MTKHAVWIWLPLVVLACGSPATDSREDPAAAESSHAKPAPSEPPPSEPPLIKPTPPVEATHVPEPLPPEEDTDLPLLSDEEAVVVRARVKALWAERRETQKKHPLLEDFYVRTRDERLLAKYDHEQLRKSGHDFRPVQLTRSQVIDTWKTIKPRVLACAEKLPPDSELRHKKMELKFTMEPSGRVKNARALEPYAGTAVEKCAVRIVRKTRWPEAQKVTSGTMPIQF